MSFTPVDPNMQALFKREIEHDLARKKQHIEDARTALEQARVKLENEERSLGKLRIQLMCNARNSHRFIDAGGGGPYGDRFIETCAHCGFTNRV